MLQVVDEIDDAIGALRQCSVGLRAEIGPALAGSRGIGTIVAALAAGAALKLHLWQTHRPPTGPARGDPPPM